MTLRAEERRALLALQAAPLWLDRAARSWQWVQLDGACLTFHVDAISGLVYRDLAANDANHAQTTEAGTELARGIVRTLNEQTRQLLRAMVSGREVVSYDLPGWAHPATGEQGWQNLGADDGSHPVRRAERHGLLVIAAGRALLTGAGRWAAEEVDGV
jgi:hypothetical protein